MNDRRSELDSDLIALALILVAIVLVAYLAWADSAPPPDPPPDWPGVELAPAVTIERTSDG